MNKGNNQWREKQLNRFNDTIFDFRVSGFKSDKTEAYIVDGIMGYGKTSAAINFINDQPDFIKFIYITPYLTEIERIKKNCSDRNFVTPTINNSRGSKMYSMLGLLEQGKNIISTHALFHNFDDRCLKLLQKNNYILIMDEVADVIEPTDIISKDIRFLLALDDEYKPIPTQRPIAKINTDTDILEWLDDDYKGKLSEFKAPAKLGCLMGYGNQRIEDKENKNIELEDFDKELDNQNNLNEKCPAMIMWNYPVSIYNAFYKIFVLTYMFEGQMQCGYYKLHKVPYKYIHVQRDEIEVNGEIKVDFNFIPETFDSPQTFDTSKYIKLIHIEEKNRCNDIGYPEKKKGSKMPLSKNWFLNEDVLIKLLKKKTYNYFNNSMRNVDTKYKMWTTFKAFKDSLKDKGYTKGYIELTARATNQYKDKYVLAYLADRYPIGAIYNFLFEHEIIIDSDQFALSEMLQWIFRSRIRDDKEIWIYIPSFRMRNLLKIWMGLEPEEGWRKFNPNYRSEK